MKFLNHHRNVIAFRYRNQIIMNQKKTRLVIQMDDIPK